MLTTAALAYLNDRIDYERTGSMPYRSQVFKLDRMYELLARLGNPHHGVDVVHVAGTKGKGSTAAMIASVLQVTGDSVGLYTSPHLERLEERFQVAGSPCTADELVELISQLQPIVDAMDAEAASTSNSNSGPTYFEITTAMALMHFCRCGVDVAVIEVGLGGRLDSTNVCWPLVSVITSVSFDHTKQLGNTLEEIAAEKAGIIKPGVPIVSGVREPQARSVIERTARDWGSELIELGRDFDVSHEYVPVDLQSDVPNTHMDYCEMSNKIHWSDLTLGMMGRHQAENAAVAIATLRRLGQMGRTIDEAAIRKGLAQTTSPARVEILPCHPIVVIDAAHNTASTSALINVLTTGLPPTRRWLIFATSYDKDVEGILRILLPHFAGVIFTQFENNPRSVLSQQLADHARTIVAQTDHADVTIHVIPTPRAAWTAAIDLASVDDLICVTGSFFIAAELRGVARQFANLIDFPKITATSVSNAR